VFFTGAWKNYDELEESISLVELIALYEHILDRRREDFKMQAALAGVDLEKTRQDSTFLDLQKRAALKAQGKNPDSNDIADIGGKLAEQEGFGVNVEGGLAYAVE